MPQDVKMQITAKMPQDIRRRLAGRLGYTTRMLVADGDEVQLSPSDASFFRKTGWAVDVSRAPAQTVQIESAQAGGTAPESDQADEGPSRTEIRRMNKSELVEHLRGQGHDVNEDDHTRDDLLERALGAA